jgi:hypothetical protein
MSSDRRRIPRSSATALIYDCTHTALAKEPRDRVIIYQNPIVGVDPHSLLGCILIVNCSGIYRSLPGSLERTVSGAGLPKLFALVSDSDYLGNRHNVPRDYIHLSVLQMPRSTTAHPQRQNQLPLSIHDQVAI